MKSKLLGFILVTAIMSTLPIFTGCAADEPPATDPDEVIELQFATFWPGTDFQVTEGHEVWARDLEERTDGKVKITIQPGEALLGATEIYEGVVDGSADIGTTCPAYTPGIFPVTEAFELPGYQNDNALVASLTVNEGYKTLKEKELIDEYDDVKVLFFWATGPGDIMTREEPGNTLEAIEEKEMRVVGGTVTPMQALGVTPVSMPMSESYLALDSALLDGILAPTDTLKGFRLAEVLDYVTKTPFLYNIVFMKVMNLETWNALPTDIQETIEEMSKEYAYEYGKLRTEHTERGLEFGIEEHGIEVFELDPGEEERWRGRIEPIVENWIGDAEARGLHGEEIINTVRELDARFSEEYGDYEG